MGTLFFWTAKLVWLVLSPDTLLLLLLGVSWWVILRGKHKVAKRWFGFVMIVILTIAFFPVDEWVMYPLESRFPTNPELPDRVDGIIVLGGNVERMLSFMSLARHYPQAKLVYSGGCGRLLNQTDSEATSTESLLEKLGFDVSRVTFEGTSRNTYENASYSMDLVTPDPNENWILITSAWHMPRAMGVFNQIDWPVIPYPVDPWMRPGKRLRIDLDFANHLSNLTVATKEWVGLLAYFVTGKTSDLFPAPLAK